LIRTLALLAVCAVLIGLALVTGCGGENTIIIEPQREPGTMRGTVISIVNDEPVPYARVHVISTPFTDVTLEETFSTTTYTDGQGWYNAVIPYGRIIVIATKDGFKRPDAQLWSLSPGGDGRLNFMLIPGENNDEIDPRIHDPFCQLCHYSTAIPDKDNDGKGAYPPAGTGGGG
jgi:hypothetical protein